MKRYIPRVGGFDGGPWATMKEHPTGDHLKRDEVIAALRRLKTWTPDADRFGPCVSQDDTGALWFVDAVLTALGVSYSELAGDAEARK